MSFRTSSGVRAALEERSQGSARPGLALDSSIWDGFCKTALLPPAVAAAKSALSSSFKKAKTVLPGKVQGLANSSGKGQLASLGRSGTSGLSALPPVKISA